MNRAVAVASVDHWPAETACDSVTLSFDMRHRRRIRLQTDGGQAMLLDLERAVALAQGDGLKLDDGRWVAVRAAPEPLLEVRGRDTRHFARIAWHLGNRHLACDVQPDRLLIRPDHVIADMLRGLGAAVREVEAPFQPEGGAYASGHGHHDHGHHDDGHHRHGHHHHGQGHADDG